MKKIILSWNSLFLSATVVGCFCLMPYPVNAINSNVCPSGAGVPPFLSAGADPNLLLIIDNSGSMLDTAYVEDPAECVDNAYDATASYAGLFDSSKWYKWTDGVTPWVSGETYGVGYYVYTEGIFYKATAASGNPSVGAEITYDSEVVWDIVYDIDFWINGTVYPAGSFVQYERQLYYTAAGGTASDPDASDDITIDGDTGIAWEAVVSTWRSATNYVIGNIVSDNGMLFRAAGNSTNSQPSEDTTGADWVRLDEGYFEEVSYTTTAAATTAFVGAAGEPYFHSHLYVKIVSVAAEESTVSAFVASGNLLNWASTSKFDIQKKILTGGKYDANEEHLISQSRGCSEHSFFKEVPVTNSGGTPEVLTLAVEGPDDVDWIDSTDFTTRISILGVSDGYADSARADACADAIAEIAEGVDANQGQIKVDTKTCLDYGDINNIMAESNSAYNHSMHECWFITKKELTLPSQLGVNDIEVSCEYIYDLDMPPATITPDNSGYICYGVYVPDGTGEDPLTDPNRPGYVGRCWETSTIPAGCDPVPCPVGTPYDTGDPRCFPDDFMYDCSGNYNGPQDSCNKPWVLQLVDKDGVGPLTCTAGDIAAATPAQWTDDNNPNDVEACIQQAVWDYCQGVSMVEVIDPTDQIFITGDTWGLPGALVDSGVAALFGTSRPLSVMKGYVKKTTAPEGILHEVADDLRIGAMAFHHNGAATECGPAYTTTNDTIVQFCPDGNKDGAWVIASIQSGVAVTDDKGNADPADDVQHVDDLAIAINNIQASAWTPLAEAIYNGLGYYGQNTTHRLNAGDFYTQAEDATWLDPVQYWCQQNYILVITEGASTTDLNQQVIDLVKTTMPGLIPALEDSTLASASETQCLNADGETLLFGSTYLDDVTYYGKEAPVDSLYVTPIANPGQMESDDGILYDKQNVITHIVTTGVLRDDGSASECNPKTIMENAVANGGGSLVSGEDPSTLEENLRAAISDILSRVSAGSAASVISSSRSGAGAVFQAIFWPTNEDIANNTEVSWVGDVHALFLDSKGLFWEDTDDDALLDYGVDHDLDTVVDRQVTFFFDENENRTRACKDGWNYPTQDPCDATCVTNACNGDIVEIDDVNYIWAVSMPGFTRSWLTNILLDPDVQRTNYISKDRNRYIFTWTDLDNDGIVDSDWNGDGTVNTAENDGDGVADQEEVLPFEIDFVNNKTFTNRGSVVYDFNVSDGNELNRIISWIRGNDSITEDADRDSVLEAAEATDINNNGVLDPAEDLDGDTNTDIVTTRSRQHKGETWRLGDVIHSTPILVGKPLEAYHYIYKDPTFAFFADHYARRRQVIYFGANDGMLHAVNAGFFIEQKSRFCESNLLDASGDCDTADEVNHPDLGAELWAYVPYNLQPHLKCLTDPGYTAESGHKYYVDQRPRIFDVQIFEEEAICAADINDPDCDHPRGWGTILVGSMRFGGATVEASDLNGLGAADKRKFISAFFILDVTNPEKPPKLLAEMTMTSDVDGSSNPLYTDLGYTTSSPAMVFMRNDDGSTAWHLIMGNGPTSLKGENTEQGKIAVLPLSWITGEVNTWSSTTSKYPVSLNRQTRKAFRIPNREPDSAIFPSLLGEGGRFLIPAVAAGSESFVADIISVDYDIGSSSIAGIGAPYKVDALYFGTIDGSGFIPNASGKDIWDGGGRLYRLVTKDLSDLDSDGDIEFDEQTVTEPWDWDLELFVDAKGPISSAPGVGWDGYNFWVYFGTGRFYDDSDKTDNQTQRFFGLKEPVDCTNGHLTWDEIDWWNIISSNAPDPTNAAATRGLMQVDQILIEQLTGDLYCMDASDNCKKDHDGNVILGFYNLKNYIVGESCSVPVDTTKGLDGWFMEFYDERERNVGQTALLGGLLTYTSYQPYADVCKAEGVSFLYGVHYQTGTAWIKSVFGTYDLDADTTIVKDRLDLGKGLALTPSLHVGSGDPDATAFVQTSTGEIWEIGQEDLPLSINIKTGRTSWQQK